MTPATEVPGPRTRALLPEPNRENFSSTQKAIFPVSYDKSSSCRCWLGWLTLRLEELLVLGGTTTGRLYEEPFTRVFLIIVLSLLPVQCFHFYLRFHLHCWRKGLNWEVTVETTMDIIWSPMLPFRSAVFSHLWLIEPGPRVAMELWRSAEENYFLGHSRNNTFMLRTTHHHAVKNKW